MSCHELFTSCSVLEFHVISCFFVLPRLNFLSCLNTFGSYMSRHTMSCHIMQRYAMSCHLASCVVCSVCNFFKPLSCHVMSCHGMSLSCQVMCLSCLCDVSVMLWSCLWFSKFTQCELVFSLIVNSELREAALLVESPHHTVYFLLRPRKHQSMAVVLRDWLS